MKRKIIAEASENERMRMKIYVLFMDSNLASIIIFDFFHLPFFAFFRSRFSAGPGRIGSRSSRRCQWLQRWRWEKGKISFGN